MADVICRISQQLLHKRCTLTRALSGERLALKQLLRAAPTATSGERHVTRAVTESPLSSNSSCGGGSDVSAAIFEDDDTLPAGAAGGDVSTAASSLQQESKPKLSQQATLDAASIDSDHSFGFDIATASDVSSSSRDATGNKFAGDVTDMAHAQSLPAAGDNNNCSFTKLRPASAVTSAQSQKSTRAAASSDAVAIRTNKSMPLRCPQRVTSQSGSSSSNATKRTRQQVKNELDFYNTQQQEQKKQDKKIKLRTKQHN